MSLFDLKQSAAELPSLNQGTSRLSYEQHPPTRDVTGTAFPNGAIHIRWQVAGTRWWVPANSYIRIRCSIGTNADPPLQLASQFDIAPNMGLAANLFQSAEFRIADKTVSRVSDYMAQVDALEKRLNKSKSWMDSVGKDLELWEPLQTKRLSQVSSNGCGSGEVGSERFTRVQQGFDVQGAGNTIAVAQLNGGARGTITFAAGGGAAIPDVRLIYKAGDMITHEAISYTVTSTPTALTVSVVSNQSVEIVAAVDEDWWLNRKASNSYCANRNNFELIWQPPLSIFKVNHAMPSGKYEIILNPQNTSVFMNRAIESSLGGQSKAQGVDFQFRVNDLYLYLNTVEGPAVDSMSYFMSLDETRCQIENMTGNSTGLKQSNFDVSPSTYALTVAFQDQTSGVDTRFSASKFKIRQITALPNAYPSGELALKRFYMQYAGQNKPSPDADPEYASPTDFLSSRYAESALYSGGYFDNGGYEDKNDWLNRGLYMYFSYPRDGSSESTRVNVNYQFGAAIDANSGNVLLFDHHKKLVLVSIVNGRVVDVLEQEG